jgi:glucan phosphoethanolaminetransferase (alkaline phosphatase superfamily)
MECDPWTALREGTPRAEVWNRYLDEIRFVLDQVATLLKNYDAGQVIITADHGELFGEINLYSHPSGIPHPRLRRVPWVETIATDSGTYRPQIDAQKHYESSKHDVEAQLSELGYVE